MLSLEFAPKTESCEQNLINFLQNCKIFTHLIIINNHRIIKFEDLKVAYKFQKIINIILTIAVANKKIQEIEIILKSAKDIGIYGVIFVSGERENNIQNDKNLEMQLKDSIILAKKYNLVIFSATNNIQKIKNRIEWGAESIITQSFYKKLDFVDFLQNFRNDEKEKIIPSFFPFFNDSTLSKWRNNNFGINIPQDYKISQNKEIFNKLLCFRNLHISTINSNFNNLLKII